MVPRQTHPQENVLRHRTSAQRGTGLITARMTLTRIIHIGIIHSIAIAIVAGGKGVVDVICNKVAWMRYSL
jgi:hypothetical protein